MREPTLADLDRHQQEHVALEKKQREDYEKLRSSADAYGMYCWSRDQTSLLSDLRWQITLKDRTIDHLSTENKRMRIELTRLEGAAIVRHVDYLKSQPTNDPWFAWALIGYALGMGTMAMLLWLT